MLALAYRKLQLILETNYRHETIHLIVTTNQSEMNSFV